MPEIKFYNSYAKAAAFLLINLGFIAFAVWMLLKLKEDSVGVFAAWIIIGFFGVGVFLVLFRLFDRRPQMIVNTAGIWSRSLKQPVVHWQQLEDAYPLSVAGEQFICLKVDDTYVYRTKMYGWALALNKFIGAQKLNLYLGPLNIDKNKFFQLIEDLKTSSEAERSDLITNYHEDQALQNNH